ncbi:MAG TPA: 50S ribosomal protein L25 [Polyangiaceae bacterium]
MQKILINAAPRVDTGKGAASRLRRTGKIPAIAYGKNLPAQSLSVSPGQLGQVFASAHGRNTVIELDVEGKDKLTVLLCDFQHHPITREYLHADFFQIQLDQEVDVDVPLELTGKPQGVVLGGTLRQVFRKLPVRCLPEQIPVKLVHDVTSLGLDAHVATRDLALPEGLKVRLAPEQTLVAIVKEKQAPEEEATPQAQAAAPAAAAGKAAAKPEAAAEKK